jgi:AraC family transcriptional regulator
MTKPDESHSDWYARQRPQFTLESRQLGEMNLLEIQQPAGAFPDPARPDWLLQIAMNADVPGRIDMGAGVISERLRTGMIALSTGAAADYEFGGEHEIVVLSIPQQAMLSRLRDLNPAFSGHFGPLHCMLWRDNTIRDCALHIWRAAKGDRHAPDLDPDAALMKLALMLMKRADEKFTHKDLAYHLAPRARRDVADFVEAHLEEDLPLFRLAEVAGLSPFHFARAFRLDMGDTPHQYVTRRRIAKAREMIRHTPAGLAEIALAAGFGSQSRMTTTFAKEEGVTPGRLRREALL